jgi:hypothetical protein
VTAFNPCELLTGHVYYICIHLLVFTMTEERRMVALQPAQAQLLDFAVEEYGMNRGELLRQALLYGFNMDTARKTEMKTKKKLNKTQRLMREISTEQKAYVAKYGYPKLSSVDVSDEALASGLEEELTNLQ